MLDKKSVFLLDGLGAVTSCLCLGLLLPALQEHIGMPLPVLHGLASLAALFAIYSLSCYRFADHDQPRWLTIIIGLNLAYCLLSLVLMVKFASLLTVWGFAYFLGEKLVVLGIVSLEWRVLKSL